jgi:hypothetical protein
MSRIDNGLIFKKLTYNRQQLFTKDQLFTQDQLFTKDQLFTQDQLFTKDQLYTQDQLYTKDQLYKRVNTVLDHGTTTADLNDIVKSGMYRIDQNPNRPSGSDFGNLIVARGVGSDTIGQILFSFNGRIWHRSGTPVAVGGGGNYSEWKELAQPEDLALGAVGTYAMMRNISTISLVAGDTVLGSNLRFSNTSGSSTSSIIPSGTWRVMGQIGDKFDNNSDRQSTCLRIS